MLVRESRQDKLLEISTAEVKEGQRARFTPEERTRLEGTAQSGSRARAGADGGIVRAASASLVYAKEHLFERVSVAQGMN